MSNLFQSKAESKNGSDRDHGLINHSIICLFRVVEKLAHVHSGGCDEDLLEEGRRWCLLLPTCKWLAFLRQLCVVMDWHWWWWEKNHISGMCAPQSEWTIFCQVVWDIALKRKFRWWLWPWQRLDGWHYYCSTEAEWMIPCQVVGDMSP